LAIFFYLGAEITTSLRGHRKGGALRATHMDVLDFTKDINVCKLTEFIKDMDMEWPFVGKQIIDFRLAGEPM
jgi:hypothetical protein